MTSTPPPLVPSDPDSRPDAGVRRRRRALAPQAFMVLGVGLLILFILVGLVLAARAPQDRVQGMVEADTFIVSTKAPSRILQLLAQEGDQVSEGELVAVVRSPEIEARSAQARALLSSSEALQSLSQEGARREDVRSVESVWRAAQATAGLADQTARRAEALFAEGVISAQRRDEAVAARVATAAQAEAARQQYLRALAGARPQERDVADANVRGARAAVAETDSLTEETRLVAPHAGEVSERFAQVGELVLTGVPVMTLVDTADPWVVFNVTEDQYGALRIGAVLYGDVPALGLRRAAFRVSAISPQGEFATRRAARQSSGYDVRSFEVKARPAQPIRGLRPGMSVLFDWPGR